MKKAIALAIAAAMVISMTACTKDANKQSNQAQQTQQPAPQKVDKLPKFAIKDLNGNVITNDFFKDNKLTIVTIWSTG